MNRFYQGKMPGADHSAPGEIRNELLEFDFRAGCFELFLSFFGSFLGSGIKHVGRSAFDEFLGIGKSETRSNFTNCLNDSDLVGTCFGDDDIKLGFFFSGFGRAGGGGRTGGDSCCGGDAPGFFELFHEIDSFQNGELAEFFYEVCNI